MPGFTPGRRWQPAYYPFHKNSLSHRIIEFIERMIKGPLFGCRMCGNCLLQETAFICPMECPKGLRNGPCGGSTPEHCYVDPTRPCIWYKIYTRAEKLGRNDRLLEVFPPLDWDIVGNAQWPRLYDYWKKKGGLKATIKTLTKPAKLRKQTYEQFLYEYRQPSWWMGDTAVHESKQSVHASFLQEKLNRGQFVVTAEVSPPITASPFELDKKFMQLKDYIDAFNFTDNPSATSRMSPLACSVMCLQNGLEPIMQIAARDYNRMGVQSTVLGASALGVRNILCLSGDHSSLGPEPHSRMDIWDIDSIQLIWMLRQMRDEGSFLDEREIKVAPSIFIGAASSPNSSTLSIQAQREAKKVNAGAQFFQTNLIYDADQFEQYLMQLDKFGVLGRVYILTGVAPIRSVKAANMMNKVPGIKIPEAIIKRMESSKDPKEEGIQIALEIIEKIKHFQGINGFHFMAVGWESIVPRMVRESGLQDLRLMHTITENSTDTENCIE